MSEPIRVLIADDIDEARHTLRRLLEFEEAVEVVGEAANGKEAVEKARELVPDFILMDINMPVMDGLAATEIISAEVPESVIIVVSVQDEFEYVRRAMAVGAREFLIKPVAGDDLIQTVQRMHEVERRRRWRQHPQPTNSAAPVPEKKGQIVTLFSAKGGVGKTTLATNLAVMLAGEFKRKVVLVDLDLQFGDVGILLDMTAKETLADLAKAEELDSERIMSALELHRSGLMYLGSPPRPELADLVQESHVVQVLEHLQRVADYVVVDSAASFQSHVLAALDRSDHMLVVGMLDLPTVKNVKLCLEVMESLNYGEERIKLVLNRASAEIGLRPQMLERNLNMPISVRVPADGRLVVPSVNRGIPFVLSEPKAPISQAMRDLARQVVGERVEERVAAARGLMGLGKVFGRA